VAKWLNQYDAENRFEGDDVFASFMMNLQEYGLSHPLTESRTEVPISKTEFLLIAALPKPRDLR